MNDEEHPEEPPILSTEKFWPRDPWSRWLYALTEAFIVLRLLADDELAERVRLRALGSERTV